ncbi:unnamed protein product [Adineta ricciae]|uniref:Pentapeptide repeat-containing protein n=1 Tax=Adineta ricciae TaxID=249248 RepID=A0A814MTP4_ADIRI|nr:unnamed protein product [Adineta ricciae]CAF1658095.1 unnamed protein product [Adineta ricciae]
MTLTTLTQLDPKRKSFLLRSLYESKLITVESQNKPTDQSVLLLERADLTDVILGTTRDSRKDDFSRENYISWMDVNLAGVTLINASFRHVRLDCANFKNARMDSIDFSFSFNSLFPCFSIDRMCSIDFSGSSLVNANLNHTGFCGGHFHSVNLTLANLSHLECIDCSFNSAVFDRMEMSFASFRDFYSHKSGDDFTYTEFRDTVVHGTYFQTANFQESKWLNVSAQEITLDECSLNSVELNDCSFSNANFKYASFVEAKLSHIDLSLSTLRNVTFRDAEFYQVNFSSIVCHWCDFQGATFKSCIWNNSTFRHSNFRDSNISLEQLQQIVDFTGSVLPNGTRSENNNDIHRQMY